jgi:hypothetical protein
MLNFPLISLGTLIPGSVEASWRTVVYTHKHHSGTPTPAPLQGLCPARAGGVVGHEQSEATAFLTRRLPSHTARGDPHTAEAALLNDDDQGLIDLPYVGTIANFPVRRSWHGHDACQRPTDDHRVLLAHDPPSDLHACNN